MNVLDGLRTLIGRLGDPTRDKAAGAHFVRPVVTDAELGDMFDASWVAKKLVRIPAEDALREWRTWHGDAREAIEAEEERLGLRGKVLEAKWKARLYGGAGIYFGTDQDPAKPFDAEAIRPGGLRYATVLSKRELGVAAIERDPLAEHYGRPTRYRISGGNGVEATVHPSRVAIFGGDARADSWLSSGLDLGWDQSVLVAAIEAITQFSGSTANVASLIFEANVDVIGIPELSQKMQTEGGESAIAQRFSLVARNKAINQSIIRDAAETYERKGASFAELTPIMEAFALFVAAAAGIPATRFLSRSPTGLVATGGHDTKNYHDMLRSIQTLDIGPGLRNLDQALGRSAGWTASERYDWNPLEREDRKELAEIGKLIVESVEMMVDQGLLTQAEARALLTHRLAEVGVFPHIEEVLAETADSLEIEPESEPEPAETA